MLKEWVWWQIEASLETLEEDGDIPLSDLTVCFWLTLALKRCRALIGDNDHLADHETRIREGAEGFPYTAVSSSIF